MVNTAMLCVCGSGLSYQHCCEPLHTQKHPATTAEALMRSRYSAYCLGNIDYIQNTMQGKASQKFDATAAKDWAAGVVWIGLQVLRAITCSEEEAQVEFIASFVEGKTLHHMHERSTFIYTAGRWFYVDGERMPETTQIVSRNGACPCGSQKKWKQCHGKGR